MSLRKGSIAAIAMFLTSLVIVRIQESGGLYSFGHQEYIDASIFGILILLCFTHAVLAALMFAQSDRWTGSDAAMFRFIAVKTIFWGNAATKYFLSATTGVTIDSLLIAMAILVSTIDLDVRLIGRYILGWEDEYIFSEDEQDKELE